MNRGRRLLWLVIAILVVAAGRQIAYGLAGGALATRLSASGGGPTVAWIAAVALAGSALSTLAGLWLIACGVRERCALQLEGWANTAPTFEVSALIRRAVALSGVAVAAFTAFESTLHYEEGLGFHGLHCIAGPVHQNAAPILVGLSLIAAAIVTGVDYVLAALRRTVAHAVLCALRLGRRVQRRRPMFDALRSAARVGVNPSRAPPSSLCP
ncbi:MAG: hypothetical protein QOG33_542 [Gaiellales bacterium]|nr:hypothetical protein [Gaiellales bacterium]